MRRQMLCLLSLVLFAAVLSGCGGGRPQQEAEQALSLSLPQAARTDRTDSHDGWLGDGETRISLTFGEAEADQVEQTLSDAPGWQTLPMGETLTLTLFGGETEQGYRRGILEEGELEIPQCQSGYWYFRDRTPEGGSDGVLRNFTAAVYDTDTHILYLVVWDS